MNLKALKYIIFALVVLLFVSGTGNAIVDSTWGFEYDVVGNQPLDAKTISESIDATIRVQNFSNNHGNNSLYINDSNATSEASISFSVYTASIINGSVTFFSNFTNTQASTLLFYSTVSAISASLRYNAGTVSYYNGTAYVALGSYSLNKINNNTIVFNSGNQTFNYYINGTLLGSGVYRQVANEVKTIAFTTEGTAKIYIDDIKFVDDATPTLNEVRKFPYPYVSAWTLSSDIDDTDWQEFFDIYDFLNTDKNISGLGVGVNLELSSNTWMTNGGALGGGKVAGCYYQNDFSLTPLCENSSITIDYLKSGHIDTMHNWAYKAFNMSVAGEYSWYLDVLSVLNGNGINITTWVNHGGADIYTNIGNGAGAGSWVGDNNTNASYYHLNRSTTNQSIRYYWESDPVTTKTDSYFNYPLEINTMDDSSKLFRFYRAKSGFSGTPFNRNFTTQINYSNIQKLIRRSGYNIQYTHLGYNGSSVGDIMNPVFDATGVQELNNLSDYYYGTDGKSKQIYVATLAKMLRYAEVSEYLNYTYNSSLGTVVIHSVNNSVRNFTPTVSDLEGITFLVPVTTNIFIGETNVSSSTVSNSADENGNVSVMFPISRLTYPYPDISSVGSYDIDSSGTVLWNRTSTRPAKSQKINITVLPSSGSVNFTSSLWNTTGDYRKVFNLSASASVIAGGFAPNTNYWIYRNGVKWNVFKSNSTGYISFSDTITAETQYSTSSATVQEAYTTSTCNSTMQWGVVGSALVIVLILISAGGMALGFITGTLKFDTFPIQEFVLTLVAVVVIGSIGVAIINPIIVVVGCP